MTEKEKTSETKPASTGVGVEPLVMLVFQCDNCEKSKKIPEGAEPGYCECGGNMRRKKGDLFEEDQSLYFSMPCLACKHRGREMTFCKGCIHFA